MENVYAQPGDSFQQIGGDCPAGWITMKTQRPDNTSIATESGEWVAAVEPPITRFSSLDYLSKFTDEEYQAVRSGPMAMQRGLDSLIAAQFVDLDDPRTGQYLSMMVAAGIIDDARKAELLTPQTP